MKHHFVTKHVLLSVLLILTLTAMLFSVSAADAASDKNAARLTVVSVKTGETTETLYATAEEAFSAADLAAQTYDNTVTLKLLEPLKGYTVSVSASHTSPLTVDLGGFTHYIRDLTALGQSTLTIQNGTLITAGSYDATPYGITVNNGALTVILEKDVTVRGADRNTVVHADGADDVVIAKAGTTPVRLISGSLVNYGSITGGLGAAAVCNDGGELYNHGKISGGDSDVDSPSSTFDTGVGVNGYYGVTLNTGTIRGGNFESRTEVASNLIAAPAVYGIVETNAGEIIGGSVKGKSASVTSGPAVYGAVGVNTGTIHGGSAHSYAESGTVYAAAGVVGWQILPIAAYGIEADADATAVVIDNRGLITNGKATADHAKVTVEHASAVIGHSVASYEVYLNSGEVRAYGDAYAFDEMSAGFIVHKNTGTVTPIAFAQAYLTVSVDGEAVTPETTARWYDGKDHTVSYTLSLGGRVINFPNVTSTLLCGDEEASVLGPIGKYHLVVTDGTQEKTVSVSIKPLHSFEDVPLDHPYTVDIAGVYQKGLMNGTDATHFSPDLTLSRAMLVTMLWRMEGCPVTDNPTQFTDVADDAWYADAIRWAASAGLVLGYDDGSFGVDNPITLEQMALILYRYEQSKGGGFTGLWMFRLNYDDIADISDWAYESVCYMVMKGIYCTPSETTLQPKKEATRAEAAVFLNRYAEFLAAAEQNAADNTDEA